LSFPFLSASIIRTETVPRTVSQSVGRSVPPRRISGSVTRSPLGSIVSRTPDCRSCPVRGVVVVASNVEELPVVAGALLVATTDRAPHTGCWLPISH